MKTTIYTVTMNLVFGAIDDLHTFVCKDEAEALVVEWANKNSAEDAPKFFTADEAIDWFAENDSEVEMTIEMHETGVDMASNDDYEMLAGENKYFAEFIGKLGYSDEQISEIANTGMLETPKQDEITTVVKLKNGILDEAKSFVSYKDAEAFFLLEVAKFEPSISDEDIEACLDNGYWDNNSGDDIFITANDLVHKITPACGGFFFKHEVYTLDDCPFFNIEDAKELIGERVDVLKNDETSEFNGLVIDASYTDIDGILITVLDQEDNAWDIHPRHIVRIEADDEINTASGQTHQCCDNCGTHESQYAMSQCPKCGYIGSKATLSAIYPKVGMQVCVGGYDDNASAGQQRFVDEHYGQLFEVLEVGEYSSKLKNVPFRVKHAHVYEIVGQGEGK